MLEKLTELRQSVGWAERGEERQGMNPVNYVTRESSILIPQLQV